MKVFFFAILITFFALNARAACTAGACYAGPSGSGTTCSSGSPCTVAQAITNAAAGDHIWLQDGTYTGANGMISISSKSGTSGSPITVSAVNEGAVLINGEDARTPIYLSSSDYWIIEGVNCENGGGLDAVVDINSGSDNNIIRRVVAWNATPTDANRQIFQSYSNTGNLFEDVAGFGTGRKIFQGYATSYLTIRRAWGEWSYNTDANPQATYEYSYDSNHVICENCIGTRNEGTNPGGNNFGAISSGRLDEFQTDCGNSNALYGSIAYALAAQTWNTPDAGMFWFAGPQGIFTAKDNVAVNLNATTLRGINAPAYGDPGMCQASFPASGRIMQNFSSIGTTDDILDETTPDNGWTVTNYDQGANVAAVYTGSNTLFINDGTTGATICYRYINGTLSTTPLWPWPMNQRIIDAMTTAGVTTVDVTATIETIFGTIPADCRGGNPTFPLTLITHTSAGSTDISNVTTSAIDTTGADLLTLEVAVYNDSPICTPTDSKSNTWTGLTAQGIVTDQRVRIYYSAHPTVGASHTFTCNGTGLAPSIAVQAWSGSATVPFDVQNGATDTNVTGIHTNDVTPTADGALIVTAVSAKPINTALSIDSSFTKIDEVSVLPGSHYGLSVGYKLVPTIALNNPTWSGDSSLNNWATDIAVFKSGATFAAPPPSVFNSPVFRPRVFFTKN